MNGAGMNMSVRFCTKCGAAVAENARFCSQCGAEIMQPMPAAAVNAAQPEVFAGDAASATAAPVKSHRKLFIGIAIGAVVIVAAVVILVLILNSGCKIDKLPYGIDPDMTGYEVRQQLIDSGFTYDWQSKTEDRTTVFYKSSLVLGYMTDFTSLYVYDDGHYADITHHFNDPGYGKGNESAKFEKVKQRLIEEYGKPTVSGTNYQWQDGIYTIFLHYYGEDGNFSVSYQYNTRTERQL